MVPAESIMQQVIKGLSDWSRAARASRVEPNLKGLFTLPGACGVDGPSDFCLFISKPRAPHFIQSTTLMHRPTCVKSTQ